MHLPSNSAAQIKIVSRSMQAALLLREMCTLECSLGQWHTHIYHAVLQFDRLLTMHSVKQMQQTLAGLLIRAREQKQPTQAMLRLTSSFQPLCDCKTCIQKSGMPDTSLSGSADTAACKQGCGHLHVPAMQKSRMVCSLLCLCVEVP